MNNLNYVKLGASLYVPSNKNGLLAIANRSRFPHLRSVIFCTEDSLRENEVAPALDNLSQMLHLLEPDDRLMRFIRVRNPLVLEQCLQMDGINKISGFVLPKITRSTINDYWSRLSATSTFEIMITLETREVFDNQEMTLLRNILLKEMYHQKILSIRIGGNDLLNHLHIRRFVSHTAYSTPLRSVISSLCTIFKPFDFNLTGPVFEGLNDATTLNREVVMDLQHGLLGKTAIHPDHVTIIENHYQVVRQDLEMAEAILDVNKPAVFGMHGHMCEPATHMNWARQIVARSECYGVMCPCQTVS